MRKKRRKRTIAFSFSVIWALFILFATLSSRVELPSSSNPVSLRCRQIGDDLRQEMVEAIHQAKQSVLVSVYALTDPQVIESLNRQARAGIRVRVATEKEHLGQIRRSLASQIEVIAPPTSGLMHRKILVVDRELIWIGSANFTTASLCLHDNLTLALASRPLGDWLEDHYDALFNGVKSLASPIVRTRCGDQEVQVWLQPEGNALATLIELIDQAQKTVRVALFAWTHPELTAALQRAKARGVDVEAVVDRTAAHGSSQSAVKNARRAHIPVQERGGRALCHHKLAIIDDRELITGSANWTRSAFEKNSECVIRVAPLTPEQRQRCYVIWQKLKGKEITTQTSPLWIWQDGQGSGSSGPAEGPYDCGPRDAERIAA